MYNINLENDIKSGSVRISQYGDNLKLTTDVPNSFFISDIRYITTFCNRIVDLEYKSVLVIGLGIGAIPFYLENEKTITNIDVIEENQDIINAVSDLNIFKNTKIYNDKFLSYNTEKKYDLIVVDIWKKLPPYYRSRTIDIENNYKKNLNEDGKIYIPILDKIISL